MVQVTRKFPFIAIELLLADDGAPLEVWELLEALVVASELLMPLEDCVLLLAELVALPAAAVFTISELEKFDLWPAISMALTV